MFIHLQWRFRIICARCVAQIYISKVQWLWILKLCTPYQAVHSQTIQKCMYLIFVIMHGIVPHTFLRIRVDQLSASCREIKRCTHVSPNWMNFGKVRFQITCAFNNQPQRYSLSQWYPVTCHPARWTEIIMMLHSTPSTLSLVPFTHLTILYNASTFDYCHSLT